MLRQLSAIFDTRALGYSSALVAAKVDPDRIDEAAAVISAHPGVSHNYKRNHAYNLWYTLAVPPGESLDEHIDVLHRESGALVTRKLPTLKLYKIGVKLDMTGKTAAERQGRGARARAARARGRHGRARARPTSRSRRSASCRRTSPLVERPFAVQAEQIGVDRGRRVLEILRVVQGAQAHAPLRRGDEPPQRRASRRTRWACGRCPTTQLDEIGPQMAGFAAV